MRTRLLALGGLAVVAALAVAAPTAAAPKATNTCVGGVKIEDPADGTYVVSLDGYTGTITLAVDEASQTFDFTSVGELSSWASVVVKGGPGAATFAFEPGVSSAAGLHAPDNAASGSYYGLSHVCFFPGSDGEEGGGAE